MNSKDQSVHDGLHLGFEFQLFLHFLKGLFIFHVQFVTSAQTDCQASQPQNSSQYKEGNQVITEAGSFAYLCHLFLHLRYMFIHLLDLVIEHVGEGLLIRQFIPGYWVIVEFSKPSPCSLLAGHPKKLMFLLQPNFLEVCLRFLTPKFIIFSIQVHLDLSFFHCVLVFQVVCLSGIVFLFILFCISIIRNFTFRLKSTWFHYSNLFIICGFRLDVRKCFISLLDQGESFFITSFVDIGMVDFGKFQIIIADISFGGSGGQFQYLVQCSSGGKAQGVAH